MADIQALVAEVTAALGALPGLTVHDGYVPKTLPETAAYIDPYVVMWAGLGDNPPELTACGQQGTDTVIWDFQTTAVAADASICRDVANAVTAALTNLRAGTGRIRRNPDGFNQATPILDTQTSPARFMLPLQWRLITN